MTADWHFNNFILSDYHISLQLTDSKLTCSINTVVFFLPLPFSSLCVFQAGLFCTGCMKLWKGNVCGVTSGLCCTIMASTPHPEEEAASGLSFSCLVCLVLFLSRRFLLEGKDGALPETWLHYKATLCIPQSSSGFASGYSESCQSHQFHECMLNVDLPFTGKTQHD